MNWDQQEMVATHLNGMRETWATSGFGYVEQGIHAALTARVESPIEAVFIAWWELATALCVPAFGPHFSLALDTQRHISIGDERFRLDAAVVPRDPIVKAASEALGLPLRIALEFDGHDYHERTREQVERRNHRDRLLQSAGWTVFHFAGSEIHREPWNACLTALSFASRKMEGTHIAIANALGLTLPKGLAAMSYAIIDDGAPNHPKFLRAGAIASWLWLCGVCYCRRHHTNGHIPREAGPTLGVPSPAAHIATLVRVGLWHETADGWLIHDYDKQYGDDAVTKFFKEEKAIKKREAGRLGGLAKASKKLAGASEVPEAERYQEPSEHQPVAIGTSEAKVYQPSVAHKEGSGVGSASSDEGSGEKPPTPPIDEWLRQLVDRYPSERVSIGYMTEHAFTEVFSRDTRSPLLVFNDILAALDNQKGSEQWRNGKVPRLDRWLKDGLYVQRHASTPAEASTGSPTAAATREYIARAKRGA